MVSNVRRRSSGPWALAKVPLEANERSATKSRDEGDVRPWTKDSLDGVHRNVPQPDGRADRREIELTLDLKRREK